jgi:SulP family sulfate permease
VWLAGALAGAMLIVLGVLRLGRVVALIPAPVISGFTSGIAVIIALGQIDNALGIATPAADSLIEKLSHYFQVGVTPDPRAMALTGAVIATMVAWPRLRVAAHVPGSLVVIVGATIVTALAGWHVPVIGNVPRSIILPDHLGLADFTLANMTIVVVPAMSIAALGAIESLLCGAVGGNMTGTRLHGGVELVAQGIGNILIPFLGGVPATAAIARTSVGIKSGGVTRLVPVLHGVILLVAALLAAPWIGRIPLASLAGVLMVTAWRMNEWHAIRFYFGRRLNHAMIAFVATLIATVVFDLTQAILIGFGISTLIFVSQISDLHVVREPVDHTRLTNGEGLGTGTDADVAATGPGDLAVYYLSGPLFFGAARRLVEDVEELDERTATLVFSLRGVPLVDATGIEVLREIAVRQRSGGGDIVLCGLQPRVEALLQRAGFLAEVGEGRVFWSTDRALRSLGVRAGAGPVDVPRPPEDEISSTLVLTPPEERSEGPL